MLKRILIVGFGASAVSANGSFIHRLKEAVIGIVFEKVHVVKTGTIQFPMLL